MQAYDSITFRYFYIGFIDFMLKVKVYCIIPIFSSPNEYENNDKQNMDN